MKKSNSFTLAETIMTLFIVGLVVTASIPMFTKNKTNPQIAPGQEYPWKYCDASKQMGLCESATTNDGTPLPVVIRKNDGDRPQSLGTKSYSMTVYTNSNSYFSPYNMFKSDKRELAVGNYIFKEDRTNFYITEDADNDDFRSDNARNIVIGKDNSFSQKPIVDTVVIGNGNKVNVADAAVNINDDTIIGNTNSTVNDVNTIIGEVNTNVTSMDLVIGSNNDNIKSKRIIIGNGLTDNTYILNIGGHITTTAINSLTFNGNLDIHGGVSASQLTTSDERLKIIKGSYTKGLKEILEVEPVVFRYKGQNAKHIGVVAQDLQKTFPEAVVKMPDGYLGVNTDPVFFAMLNALKEVNQKADEEAQKQIKLQKELDEIKAELETLSACKNDDFWSKIKCFWYDTKMFFKGLIASEVKHEKV